MERLKTAFVQPTTTKWMAIVAGMLIGMADTALGQTSSAIDFGGTNAHVAFGPAPGLGVSTLTVEAWFRRDGAGATASTGTGGIVATPIVTKGRGQADGSNLDMNYFLGIDASGRLAADFEDSATGLNHPITGATVVPISTTWHHAAATYDGATWRLYLDGVLDGTAAVGAFTPRFDSIQHAAIGSALTSTGAPAGFFDGVIDEVRVWNRALSQTELRANINLQLATATNLVARWGLNEGSGTSVGDSGAGAIHGTIVGAAFAWTSGAPFNITFNEAPTPPSANAPANGAVGQSTSPTLSAGVFDPDGDPISVTFYGRPTPTAAGADFTLVALPDTQHYSDDAVRAATFTAQTQWIVNNRAALNIPFVTHLGDIVENIDAVPAEWTRANTSMSLLDGQVAYGLAPGNHDMNSAGVATNYDLTFPVSRMAGYPWYGGYLGQNLFGFTDPVNRENKNNFELFSSGGMDFIIIHLEYDMPGYAVAWANRVLAAYPTRRAIISTHLFLDASGSRPATVLNRTVDGTPASAVWTSLIFPNCNVFLVLNGHYPGEANRSDLNACGRPVHQLASDYQSRVNGGDGWLRYMTFKPAENKIYVYTFSPTLGGGAGQFEADANSQFVLDYEMQGVPFTVIATNTNVPSGGTTEALWPGRLPNTSYEWFVAASDGRATTSGPVSSFTTNGTATFPLGVMKVGVGTVTSTPFGIDCGTDCTEVYAAGEVVTLTATPDAGGAFAGWSGACVGTGPCQLTMNAAQAVTATFTSASGPTVTVLSPNAGEKLFTGSSFTVDWSAAAGSAALASFSVQYSTDGGASFVAMPRCSNLSSVTRQCVWAAPVATALGRVRVVAIDAAGQAGLDTSDSDFSVVSGVAVVAVTAPATATTLAVGSVIPITWTHNVGTATFAARFSVDISRVGTTGPWTEIASNVSQLTATTGRFDWTVAAPTSTTVRFRVRPNGFAVQGMSAGNVTIASPVLTLTAPSSGQIWTIGRTSTFRWTTNLGAGETVRVELSRDAGATWTAVVASVAANSGQYAWTVNGPATTRMRARVTWNRNPAVASASSGNNTIR